MSGCCSSAQGARKPWRLIVAVLIVLGAVVLVLATGCGQFSDGRGEAYAVHQDSASRIGVDTSTLPSDYCGGSLGPQLSALLAGDLTEDAAVKIALLNNHRVAAVYERLGIARAQLIQAGLLRNPVFDGNAKFFSGTTEIELGLSQPFLDAFFIPLRQQIARAELTAARADVTRFLVQVAYDVRRAFITIRGAQDLVELRKQVLKAAETSRDLMRRLHEAGNVTDPRVTSEEAASARARLDLAESETAVQSAREPLNVLLGLWGERTAWRITGRLEDIESAETDVQGIESRAIAASLDLRAARARIDAAAQFAGLASLEGVISTGEVGVAVKQETTGDWGVGPSAAFSIPIFDFGRARNAAAASALRERVADYTALAVEVRSAARALRERAVALRTRAVYVRTVLIPLRSRLTRETMREFNAMQIGAFEVLLVRQQEVDAGREYIETLKAAWLARLDLGELLAGSLNHARLSAMESTDSSQDETPKKEH